MTTADCIVMLWCGAWGVYGLWYCLEKVLKEFNIGETGRTVIEILVIGALVIWVCVLDTH